MSVEWVSPLHPPPYKIIVFSAWISFAYWNKQLCSFCTALRLQLNLHYPGYLLGCLFGVNCWCSSHCINLPSAFSASIYHCGLGRVHSSWWDAIHGEWGVVGKWLMTSMFAAQHTKTGTNIPGWCVCCTANTENRVMNTFAQFWLILTELFYTSLEMTSIYNFFFFLLLELN